MHGIRVAIIGAGAMAREHIIAFQAIDGVDVVGIQNRTKSKAEALATEFKIPFVAENVDDLYESTEAELVVMAVYEPAIFDTAMKAFSKPWAVLMEKPIGLDLEEARSVAEAAGDKPVFVGLNRRTLASTILAYNDLALRNSPRFIHVQDQQNLEAARAIGHEENVVQNWMYANSIHLVDYIRHFGRGEIREVDVLSSWNADEPGLVLAKIEFESGDVGLYEAQWHAPGPWACTVSDESRRWELRPLEQAVSQNAGERIRNEVDCSEPEGIKPGFSEQAKRVIATLRGDAGAQVATIDDAIATTELVAKIYGKA